MLIPITRQKFEQLIPLLATGNQYKYYWGKPFDFLLRLLISVVSAMLLFWIETLLGQNYATLLLITGIFSGSYWLWGPVFRASLRNFECRRYKYGGFLRGEVLDLFVSEEVVGKEQTVNKRGELVIVENRERRLNLEVGDETGFSTELQVPLRRAYKAIRRGQTAEMVVMSNKPDLGIITKVTDIYLPDQDLWVSDYPYLQRDEFIDLSRRLAKANEPERQKKRRRRPESEPNRREVRPRQEYTTEEDW